MWNFLTLIVHILIQNYFGKVRYYFVKLKIHISYDPSITFLDVFSRSYACATELIDKDVHSGFVHNSKKLGTI